MSDSFSAHSSGLNSPATSAQAITPSDSNALATTPRALYVGGAGDVSVILIGDASAVTFSAVPAGTILPLRCSKVRATGTTATNIVGIS